jgi:hypothetical protein
MHADTRYDRAAARIARRYGVHVEWAPANREYVVEQRPCRDAREAERYARQVAAELVRQ